MEAHGFVGGKRELVGGRAVDEAAAGALVHVALVEAAGRAGAGPDPALHQRVLVVAAVRVTARRRVAAPRDPAAAASRDSARVTLRAHEVGARARVKVGGRRPRIGQLTARAREVERRDGHFLFRWLRPGVVTRPSAMAEVPAPPNYRDIVKLNVGGREMSVLRQTLDKYPGSRLAASARAIPMAPNGPFFVDSDPEIFSALLQAVRRGTVPILPTGISDIAWDAEVDFWGPFVLSEEEKNRFNLYSNVLRAEERIERSIDEVAHSIEEVATKMQPSGGSEADKKMFLDTLVSIRDEIRELRKRKRGDGDSE